MQRSLSRFGDVLIAVAVLLFALPLIALVCVAIKMDSEGPVFSYERRLGRGSRRFSAVRFRTTEHDPERASRAMWDRGARETKIGRALHHTRIEELPMLFNVVLGDIQLIGSERTEGRDLRQLAKWAAWAVAAAVVFQAVCCLRGIS